MKLRPARVIPALAFAAAILGAPLAQSQTPAPPPLASGDAAMAAQKAAFLALPEDQRRAAQDALVWVGFYNGAADGDFGKRTRDAILAFQASLKAPADGALSPSQLKALLAAAEKAREAVGFQIIGDAKTGAMVGAPTKLVGGRGGAKLEFASSDEPDLSALYQRLIAESATRKVTYKAMRPDVFFVVAGQDGAMKFYTRFESRETARPPIRGFTFAYPAARAAELDRVAIAVANSFSAFPTHANEPPSPPPAAGAQAAAPPAGSPPKPPSGPVLTATALVVAPGRAVTALRADACPNASVGGKPVRFERADPGTGLAIIAGEFEAKGETPRLGALAPDLVVLSFVGRRVAASSASVSGDPARPIVMAALERTASGAPVLDRSSALVGVVEPIGEEPPRIAGVALAAPHEIVGPEALRNFLGSSETAPEGASPLSAGDIAAREKGALIAVYCQQK